MRGNVSLRSSRRELCLFVRPSSGFFLFRLFLCRLCLFLCRRLVVPVGRSARVQRLRLEHRVDPQRPQLRQVPVLIPRVRPEILVRGELRRVDVDADDDRVGSVQRGADEGQVPSWR